MSHRSLTLLLTLLLVSNTSVALAQGDTTTDPAGDAAETSEPSSQPSSPTDPGNSATADDKGEDDADDDEDEDEGEDEDEDEDSAAADAAAKSKANANAKAKATADASKDGGGDKVGANQSKADSPRAEDAPTPAPIMQATAPPKPEGVSWLRLRLATEIGFLNVLYNRLQEGTGGTEFDFAGEGGQELFYFFWRASAELEIAKRHNVIFLYQPINLQTQVRFRRDVTVDELTFPENTPMDLRYGFDFYRLTYHYDLAPSEEWEIGVGGGFQMRDAAIIFTSADGTLRRDNRDLGPVPLLKFRLRAPLGKHAWVGAEVDGFYASFKIANGSTDADVTGAIVDGSIRGGVQLRPGLDAFLNLRYVGGGGEGTSPTDAAENPGDGFTKNWLHAVSMSLGFYFEPAAIF